MLDNSPKKTNYNVQPCDRQAVTVATAKTKADIDEHYCDRIAVSVATEKHAELVNITRIVYSSRFVRVILANAFNIKRNTIWNAEHRPMDA